MADEQKHLNECCIRWRELDRSRIGMQAGPAKKALETEIYRALRKVANATDSLVKKPPER